MWSSSAHSCYECQRKHSLLPRSNCRWDAIGQEGHDMYIRTYVWRSPRRRTVSKRDESSFINPERAQVDKNANERAHARSWCHNIYIYTHTHKIRKEKRRVYNTTFTAVAFTRAPSQARLSQARPGQARPGQAKAKVVGETHGSASTSGSGSDFGPGLAMLLISAHTYEQAYIYLLPLTPPLRTWPAAAAYIHTHTHTHTYSTTHTHKQQLQSTKAWQWVEQVRRVARGGKQRRKDQFI